ncbi:hypothetical protein KAI19_03925 [bacterium]|nr:hypothetical protein [bacterium]
MIIGNLALKLEDFEDDYCYPHLVNDYEENLPFQELKIVLKTLKFPLLRELLPR